MNGLPAHVDIREVGPRDGFQNEPETIATADKIDLINRLARTGLRRIEVASFVRPDVIPQLSDGVEVLPLSLKVARSRFLTTPPLIEKSYPAIVNAEGATLAVPERVRYAPWVSETRTMIGNSPGAV